jgi:hypothetical protein
MALGRTYARDRFFQVAEIMSNDPSCRVVFIDSALLARALELYRERTDKQWGLVDCASFIVMGDQKIVEALTTDRHFEQAGFKILLPAL